jgi:hypothetical protein
LLSQKDNRAIRRIGACARAREQTHFSAGLPNRGQLLCHLAVYLIPVCSFAFAERLAEPLGVVQIENLSVRRRAQTAARERVFGIAFEFDRTTIADAGQRATRRAASAAGGGVPVGDARRQLDRLCDVRNDLLFGRLATLQRHRRRRQPRQFDERAARHAGFERRGEFILRLLGQRGVAAILFQAFPVSLPAHTFFSRFSGD